MAFSGPATVLGPVIGWLRLAVMLPMVIAMTAYVELSGWSRWVIVFCCAAVVYGALTAVPNRWGVYLAVNFWFAAGVVVARMVWEPAVPGPWAAILGALVVSVVTVLAEMAARQLLLWLVRFDDDDVVMDVEVHIGVWWGQAATTRPVLLSLVNGKGVMLWPGYRYVWRLSAGGYAPTQANAAVSFDEDSDQ